MRLDLVTHCAVCFGITLALLPFTGLAWAAFIVLLIGVGKETYDCYKPQPTGFDMSDLAADVVGILIASAVHAVTCLILNFPIL